MIGYCTVVLPDIRQTKDITDNCVWTNYTVKWGDTYDGLSVEYWPNNGRAYFSNLMVEKNGIKPEGLKAGQQILLPVDIRKSQEGM